MSDVDAGASSGETQHSRRPLARVVVPAALIAALTLPVLVIVLRRWSLTNGDVALIEMRVRDVFSAHPPVVGPYSRYGWSHPGPLMFYVFAVPYRVFGADAEALRLVALLCNTVVLALMAWLLTRRGAAALTVVMLASAALVFGLEPHALADSWNVTLALTPFMLTLVACWCALCGDRHAALVAALGFSFVFQTHVGFGVVLAPAFLATVGALTARAWRSRDGRRRAGRLALLFALTFLPVVYDTLTDWPGNLGRLLRWSASNDEVVVGFADSLWAVARATSLSFVLHPRLPVVFSFAIDEMPEGTVPGIALVALALAAWMAIRRSMRSEAWLCGLLAITWCAAVLAISNIARPLYFWLIDWLQPLTWLTWAAVVLVGWRVVQQRLGTTSSATVARTMSVLGALAVGVIWFGYTRAAVRSTEPSIEESRAIELLTDGARSADLANPVRLEFAGDDLFARNSMAGVANQLDSDGSDVCVAPELKFQYGFHRVCDASAGPFLLVRAESTAQDPPDGGALLAVSDPLTPAERTEADQLAADLEALLLSEGLDDKVSLLYSSFTDLLLAVDPPPSVLAERASIERLAELRRHSGARVALYLVDG